MAGRNHLTPSFFVSVRADRHFYFVNEQHCQYEYIFHFPGISCAYGSAQSFITNQIAQLLDIDSEHVLVGTCIFRNHRISLQHLVKLLSDNTAKIMKNDFTIYGTYLCVTVTAEKPFPFIISFQSFIADFDLPYSDFFSTV